MHSLLLLATQIPGETTVNKALDTDPVVLVGVAVLAVAIAMVVGAITVLVIVRIFSRRSDTDSKMVSAVIDAKDSKTAAEIKSFTVDVIEAIKANDTNQLEILKQIAEQQNATAKATQDFGGIVALMQINQNLIRDDTKLLVDKADTLKLEMDNVRSSQDEQSTRFTAVEKLLNDVLAAIEKLPERTAGVIKQDILIAIKELNLIKKGDTGPLPAINITQEIRPVEPPQVTQ